MTINFRALAGLRADTPYDIGRSSKALVDYYVDTMKENILRDGELTTVAIFRSETGQHVVDCRPLMDSNESKDILAATIRKMVIEFEAVAFVFAAEAWTATYDAKDFDKDKTPPCEHPDRVECVMLSAQYKGDKPVMRVAEIVRDPQGKIRHLLEKDLDTAEDMGIEGRFADVFDEETEDERWKRIMDGI
jgi:hypothetical protein